MAGPSFEKLEVTAAVNTAVNILYRKALSDYSINQFFGRAQSPYATRASRLRHPEPFLLTAQPMSGAVRHSSLPV